MQFALQQLSGRQLCKVFGDANATLLQFQHFDSLVRFLSAQDQSQRLFFAWAHFVFPQPSQIKLHLAEVRRREFSKLQVNGDQSPQPPVVKQQIQIKILPVHDNALLTRQECPISAQFRKEGFQLAQNGAFQVLLGVRALQAEKIQNV